jgi:hypothetical protein
VVPTGNAKFLRDLDRWRDMGSRIFGPTPQSAALEVDREAGMKAMEAAGIELPHYECFNSLSEAEAFAKKSDKAWVFKPLGSEENKALTYVAADPDYELFFTKLAELVELLLPRFVQEGKKYTTVAIGCTGGRHRSVYLTEKLAERLSARIAADRANGGPGTGWRIHVSHRELAREGLDMGKGTPPDSLQAREA